MPRIEIDRARSGLPSANLPQAGFLPNVNPGAGQGLQAIGGALTGFATAEMDRRKQEEILVAQTEIDRISNEVFQNPNTLAENEGAFADALGRLEPHLSEAERLEVSRNARRTLSGAYLDGLIENDDPERAVDSLKSGIHNEILTPQEMSRFSRSAEQEVERRLRIRAQERAQEQKSTISLRRLQIFNGELKQTDLEKDLEAGAYGPGEFIALSDELKRRNEQKNADLMTVATVEDAISRNVPLDTTDTKVRKQLDTYYNTVIAPQLTPQNADLLLSTFIKDTSYLPKTVKQNLMAQLHNGTTEQVVSSAQVIDRIVKEEPQIAHQFRSRKDIGRARLIINNVNAGMPNEDAVKAADNSIVQKATPEYIARTENYNANAASFDQDEITSFFLNDPNEVPEAMINDWKRIYQTYSIDQGLALDDAEDLAYRVIQSNWQITNINGTEEYMKNAPEIFYNKRGLDPKWIREQLIEEVQPLLPEKEFTITPDINTIHSPQPQYLIRYEDENGIPLFLKDEDGVLLRWKPDITASETAAQELRESATKAEIKRLMKGSQRPASLEEINDLAEKIKRIREKNANK